MSLLRPEAAKLRALALTLTFSTGEAAAVLVPEDAVFWLSCSIICMVIMATPDPTPTPAPARAQRPKREREVYMAKFADILCFFACGEFFVVGRRGCVSFFFRERAHRDIGGDRHGVQGGRRGERDRGMAESAGSGMRSGLHHRPRKGGHRGFALHAGQPGRPRAPK